MIAIISSRERGTRLGANQLEPVAKILCVTLTALNVSHSAVLAPNFRQTLESRHRQVWTGHGRCRFPPFALRLECIYIKGLGQTFSEFYAWATRLDDIGKRSGPLDREILDRVA